MSFKDPFRKSAPKQPETTSNQAPKIDATRENVKKQLINALEKNKDQSISDLVKTSEQIAIEIEQEIFEQNENSSKKREYRDKIRKLEMRIKGMRNNYIREILKKGILSVHDFCNLDEKTLGDENYFKKLNIGNTGNISSNNNNKNISNASKIIKPPIMPKNIIPSIRPVIPKPIIPVIKKDNNLNNINKIQEKSS